MFIPTLPPPLPTPIFSDVHIQTSDVSQGCQSELMLYKETVLMNSGKSMSSLGLFDDCINFKANFKYNVMKYGLFLFTNRITHAQIGVQMGLCVPSACNEEEVQTLVNKMLDNISYPVNGTFKENPQNFFQQKEPLFYFTIVLLILLILLAIVSTCWKQLSKKSAIIDAFNFKKNMNIFEYKPHKFNVFNGIKSLSMMWVVIGHMFSVRLQNIINVMTVSQQLEVPHFLILLGGFYAVDVFFYIGGFLVAYSFLRNQMKSVMKYPLAIVHRVLRFWPSYIVVIIIYYSLMLHTGSGPLWYKLETAGQFSYCSGMWKTMLFVDNIVQNGEKMCMGWGWYLQNDMQIFILSIPLLFLYSRSRMGAYLLIQALIGGSLAYNFHAVQTGHYVAITHRSDFAKWSTYFPNVYIKPWTRCPPYFYGLTLGLLYMQFLDEEKNKRETRGIFTKLKDLFERKRWFKNVFQLVGLSIILFIMFIIRILQAGGTWPQVAHSFYLTFSKLFFVVGVSMLATPSLLGIKGDFFFWLMDTKMFNFMAKVSFWTYLIHYMVVEFVCYRQKTDFYFDVGDVFTLYVPVTVIAMFLGFLGTVLVENPFAKLQKLLFEGKKKKDHHGEKEKQTMKVPMPFNQSIALSNSVTNSEIGSIVDSSSCSVKEGSK